MSWRKRKSRWNSDRSLEESDEETEEIPVKKPKKTKKKSAQPTVLYQNPPGEPASNVNFMHMNDDCIREILTYLDAEELCSLSTQCQRLQNLTADALMNRFPTEVAEIRNFQDNGHWLRYPGSDNHIVSFADFTKISIGNSVSNSKSILSLKEYLHGKNKSRIDEIRFDGWRTLRPVYGKAFADIVKNTKSVIFASTKIIGEFYTTILSHFPSMERLVLWNSIDMTCKDDERDNWLLQKYRNLRSFSWFLKDELRIGDEMKQFFEQNDTIEEFSLFTSRIDTVERFKQADIEITHLYFRITDNVETVLDYLKTNCGTMCLHLLFEDGCWTQLTLNIKLLVALKNNLEGLYLGGRPPSKPLAKVIGQCVQLKHLQVGHTNNVELFASLPNLENLYMARGVVQVTFHRIRQTMFSIAKQAPKLKNIFLRNSCRPFRDFNFQEFDTERVRLPDASKVTIHIRTKAEERRHELTTMRLHYDLVDITTVEKEDVVNPLVTNWLYVNK